jgi:hypothetical protein
MRKELWIVFVAMSSVLTAGCGVIISEQEKLPDDTQVEYESLDEEIDEIDAVSKMQFDLDRQEGYKRIAIRQGLSEPAQVYLVEAVFDKLSFESAKEEVLLTLIASPGFSRAAEQAILQRLDELDFESNKRKILGAISDRKATQR